MIASKVTRFGTTADPKRRSCANFDTFKYKSTAVLSGALSTPTLAISQPAALQPAALQAYILAASHAAQSAPLQPAACISATCTLEAHSLPACNLQRRPSPAPPQSSLSASRAHLQPPQQRGSADLAGGQGTTWKSSRKSYSKEAARKCMILQNNTSQPSNSWIPTILCRRRSKRDKRAML